jgi:2,5-furandicarboxylate decarboxylase 1
MIDDLRSQLQAVEEWGDLARVSREVDPRGFEIPAISKKLEADKAVFFEKVKGYSLPVVVGLDNSHARIARALGTDDYGLTERYLSAIRRPLPAVPVSDGPVKEVKITKGIDLLGLLPVITHYEKDGGPYITSGLVIAEDPANRVRNVSYHRLQITGKDEIRLLIQPRHLYKLYTDRERENKPLPVAIVIGLDTAIRLCGATWGSLIPLGLDELAIAGALRGKAVEIVRAETQEVMVPAKAEIVIEGEILPTLRKTEGPFAEFTGTYGDVWENPVLKVTAVTHRKNPIYQDLLTFTPEHHLLLAVPYEPVVYEAIRTYVPGARAVHVTPSSCGKFHAVVAIKKEHEGDGKDAILAGLYAVRDIKLVTVVDDDVDPFNPRDVEWAIATRFQADRDLVVIAGAKGNELDPSCPQLALTAKMGIDATKPLTRSERFEKIRIPGIEKINLREYLKP